MVVLHYAGITKNPSSGVSTIIPQIVNAQAKKMDVLFYNYGESCFPVDDGVLLRNREKNDDYHTFPVPFNKPDIVVFHSPFGIPKSIRIAAMLRKDKIPYIVVPHGCFTKYALKRKRLKKLLAMQLHFKRMFLGAAAVQFLSQGECTSSVYTEKGIIIPNGVSFPDGEPRVKAQSGIRISFIGRKDIYHKGLDILITACGIAKQTLTESGATVCLYGPHKADGSKIIKKMIVENGVDALVQDCSPVFGEEKRAVLQSTDLIVLTSRSEGLPGIVLEAWANGCPTLLTPGTNMAEEAAHNHCGWQVAADPQSVADMLCEICKDPEQLRVKSALARQYAWDQYHWDSIAEKYYEVYEHYIVQRI